MTLPSTNGEALQETQDRQALAQAGTYDRWLWQELGQLKAAHTFTASRAHGTGRFRTWFWRTLRLATDRSSFTNEILIAIALYEHSITSGEQLWHDLAEAYHHYDRRLWFSRYPDACIRCNGWGKVNAGDEDECSECDGNCPRYNYSDFT